VIVVVEIRVVISVIAVNETEVEDVPASVSVIAVLMVVFAALQPIA
jgi:hypothetical protein